MLLEQHIECILQSKHQQNLILKLPIHMNRKAVQRPTVNIDAVRSANVTRYAIYMHSPGGVPAYTTHSSDVHRFQTDMYDYYYITFSSKFLF